MFVLLFSLFSILAQAQPLTSLKGTIIERGTRKPLQDVSVFILPHKLKAVSDARGNFTFPEVPEGNCEIIVNLSGYQKYTKTGVCTPNKVLPVYLEKISYTSFETTVT